MEYIYQVRLPKITSTWTDVSIIDYEKYSNLFGCEIRKLKLVELSKFDMWWDSLSEEAKSHFNKSDAIVAFNAGADSK